MSRREEERLKPKEELEEEGPSNVQSLAVLQYIRERNKILYPSKLLRAAMSLWPLADHGRPISSREIQISKKRRANKKMRNLYKIGERIEKEYKEKGWDIPVYPIQKTYKEHIQDSAQDLGMVTDPDMSDLVFRGDGKRGTELPPPAEVAEKDVQISPPERPEEGLRKEVREHMQALKAKAEENDD